jgi:hypothetical protein
MVRRVIPATRDVEERAAFIGPHVEEFRARSWLAVGCTHLATNLEKGARGHVQASMTSRNGKNAEEQQRRVKRPPTPRGGENRPIVDDTSETKAAPPMKLCRTARFASHRSGAGKAGH